MKTIGTDESNKLGQTVHAFELAGLGKAPFQFVGVRENAYTVPGTYINRAGGSCDYCMASIRWECAIKSSDGKTFKVGSDCVAKTGDHGLRRFVDAEKKKRESEKRAAKHKAKWIAVKEELAALMGDSNVKAKLASLPHPRGFVDRETGTPLTMLDQVEWMAQNAGVSGKEATVALIKKAIAA